MLQLQYYNSKIKKRHIEKILSNYNMKYHTLKNEIDAKINNMIKLFIHDIKDFLENIEEISKERRRMKQAENIQRELEILKLKLEEKKKKEIRMKEEIENLTKENDSLKLIINKNYNNKEDLTEKPEQSINKRFKKLKNNPKKSNNPKKFITKNMNYNIQNTLSASNRVKNNRGRNNVLSTNLEKKNNSMDKKYVNEFIMKNNPNTKNLEKFSATQKTNKSYIQLGININGDINVNKDVKTEKINNKELNISGMTPFCDNMAENDIDNIIMEEIKELEQDEEDILLLLDKIKFSENVGTY